MSPCRYKGRPNATIDALAMTGLSRSKNAASIDGSISAPLPGARPAVIVPHPFPLRPVPTRPGRVPLLYACWSPKGGSGTTVVTAALGLLLARAAPPGALLADLAGDPPTALGVAAPTGIGLADWLAAGPDVPDDALGRLEIDAGDQLRLLPWRGAPGAELASSAAGSGDPAVAAAGRGEALAAALSADPRPVVVDCGAAATGAALAVAASATVSLLVIRPCYLALRRA